ncbi:hypothetical protein EVAR_11678_1 [Eumeta japonica]|uniref:Uncharacterized protein n=1 Tax=Eumeta variegata TaxID=151549 RepID=A0A4C1U4G8_EUMVA|nr:hypothetical protein EVAR_11678_1 [Eumeta japonica]
MADYTLVEPISAADERFPIEDLASRCEYPDTALIKPITAEKERLSSFFSGSASTPRQEEGGSGEPND